MSDPTPPARRAAGGASRLDAQREALRDRISAYPGSVTFLDLIRKNKRESALLIAGMIALNAVLGAAIGGMIGAYASSHVSSENAVGRAFLGLLPSAGVGLLAGVTFASLASLWSWKSGGSAILRMSGAHELHKADDPELFNVVDEVRIAAGLPMPRVFVIDDTALNAFATGRDPAHAAVAITKGLRQTLSRDELQGVMAHEVAHIRHYDIRFSMLMATLVGLIVFAADAMLRVFRGYFYYGGGGRSRRSSSDKGGGAQAVVMIVMVVVVLILAVVAPIVARLLQMAYSRKREYLADAGAVELTRNPEGLASALSRLAMDPDPLVDAANRGTAHMFIVNPLKKMRGQAKQNLNSAFSSHPPIKERIARLLALTR